MTNISVGNRDSGLITAWDYPESGVTGVILSYNFAGTAMPDDFCRDVIRVLIISERSMTTLGLKGALTDSDDIEIVGDANNIDDALEAVKVHRPNLVLVDFQSAEQRHELLTKLPSDVAVGIIFLNAPQSDAEIIDGLRTWSIGFCLSTISKDNLLSAIRNVHSGYCCLPRDISARLSQLLGDYNAAIANDSKRPHGFDALTEREIEVLQLIASGMTNPQIAKRLIVSEATAKAHVRSILSKLGVPDRTTAAVEAIRRGLVAR